MTETVNGDFSKWQNLILSELKRLDATQIRCVQDIEAKVDAMKQSVDQLRIDVAVLRSNAITWGSISGGLGAGLLLAANYIFGLLTS